MYIISIFLTFCFLQKRAQLHQKTCSKLFCVSPYLTLHFSSCISECSSYLPLLNCYVIFNPPASLIHNWNNSSRSFSDLSYCQIQDILQTSHTTISYSYLFRLSLPRATIHVDVQLEQEAYFPKQSNRLAILWRQDILRTYKSNDEWFILALCSLHIMLVVRQRRSLQGLKDQAKELRIIYICHKKPFYAS